MAQAKANANAPGRPFLSAYSAATVVVAAGIVLSWQSGHLAKFVSISQAHLDRIRQHPSDSPAQPPAAQSPAHALVAPNGEEEAACRLSGQVVDCGCDFASVERMNHQYLHPLLSSIVQQPFFRFFKVNLYCDCHFWPDDGMCMRKDCCVSECDENEIPAAWRAHDKALEEARKRECKGHTSQVDRSVPAVVQGALSSVVDWQALNNPWLPEDESHTNDPEYIYVDLTKNAEKYTGYKGEDARRIWAAIYDQSALKEAAQAVSTQGMEPVAREQQVLYRLISGMHASITVSIVNNYYDEATGTWGPNLPFFKARFGSPTSRPYVENLYFTLLFVLRAVTKARSALLKLDYSSGFSVEEAAKTQKQVADLVNYPELQAACPTPFDEGMLWRHDPQHSELLRQRLQTAFHNITRLMDCVGCEKCKLNGKFQMLGIATALRVLFSQEQHWHETTPGVEETQEGPVPSGGPRELILERNAAIALVNFLAKLSESVEVLRMLSQHVKDQETAAAAIAK